MALEDILELWAAGAPWADQVEEWTTAREAALPELNRLADDFLAGRIGLADFSRSLDGFGKRTNLWGYSGYSGQMFLNVLMRSADHARLEEELREAIPLPIDEEEAQRRIDRFVVFVQETHMRAALVGRFPPQGRIRAFLHELFLGSPRP